MTHKQVFENLSKFHIFSFRRDARIETGIEAHEHQE